MSLLYKDLLFTALIQILDTQQGINWFLNKELSDSIPQEEGLSFSFFEKSRTFDLPFERHPGYLIVEKSKEELFRKVFLELIQQYHRDINALSNIYIIYQGISASDVFLDNLLKDYKKIVGQSCTNVFDHLCTSLNSKYFAHYHLHKTNPENIDGWINIFRSAQSFHTISDPVINVLQLVREERNRTVAYKWLLKMKPLLRAPLVDWYEFNVDDTDIDLKSVIKKNKHEASFIAAILIETIDGTDVPAWLTEDILEVFLNQYWEGIGKILLFHAFGNRYRHDSQSAALSSLQHMLGSVLDKSIKSAEEKNNLWTHQWEFPDTFIAFFHWLSDKKETSISVLPEPERRLIVQKLLDALQMFIDKLPKYLSSDSSRDAFNSYQFLDEKYRNALGFLLLYLLEEPEEIQKRLKSMFFKVRPLFFCSYEASHQAEKFTEFMLVLVLSIVNLHDLNDSMKANWEKLLKSLSDTLLVPYLHLTERNDVIWDKGKKIEGQAYHAGLYLINNRLGALLDGPYSEHLNEFIKFFNSVKVAQWPFERRAPKIIPKN